MTHSKNSEKQQEKPDFLRQLVQTYLSEWIPLGQEYLEQEMACHLGALPYERTQHRRGHRNGYKPRQLNPADGGGSLVWANCSYLFPRHVTALFPPSCLSVTSLGVALAVNGTGRPAYGEPRSEKALLSCLQEMVIQGVATRRVAKITESLCGLDFSKSQVLAICKKLDTEIQAWLNRPLEQPYPYVFVDARYEKIRRDHKVESHGALIALTVNGQGKRDILGVEVCNTENDTNWSDFFHSLIQRGLKGVLLVISDDHGGLVSAIPTALAVDESSDIPTSFTLHPAYPNPFNTGTTLWFDLPKAAKVILIVYDTIGHEIVRLVDEYMEPGYRQVTWNGRDGAGRDVPTGIYFARLITPQYAKSIKIVLLK